MKTVYDRFPLLTMSGLVPWAMFFTLAGLLLARLLSMSDISRAWRPVSPMTYAVRPATWGLAGKELVSVGRRYDASGWGAMCTYPCWYR